VVFSVWRAAGLAGLAVDELERQTPAWHSPTLAVGLLVLVLIGVTLMPASGFWLALPVAWRLWR